MGRKSRTKTFKTILINYLVLTHKPCFIIFYKRTRILHPKKGEIFHHADFTSFDITIHVILWCETYGPPCITRCVARNLQWWRLFWGLGGALSRWRPMGVWGRCPQPPEVGGLEAKPLPAGGTGPGGGAPSARKFCIFL